MAIFSQTEDPSVAINVIGSGVLGLTCALELAQRPGSRYRLTIITAENDLETWAQDRSRELGIESDFASPWAGAFWHPFTPHPETELEKRIAQWETTSFKKLWKISDEEPSVVMKVDFLKYYDHQLLPAELPWYMTLCPQARRLNQEELAHAPKGKVDGITCKAITLNSILYLEYLRKKLSALDVKIIHHRLKSVSEAFIGNQEKSIPSANVVINASGLGAGKLEGVEDPSVEPIRGQCILIKPPKPIQIGTRDDEKRTYIISRPPTIPGEGEEVVLGGCYQPGNSDLTVDDTLADWMLDEALKVRPDLSPDGSVKGVKVLKHIAALRPGRKGGPRIEAEKFLIPVEAHTRDADGTLIHCYGIGGGGFQASFGIAEEVFSLVEHTLA